MNMCITYRHLCPPENKKASDYILEWIKEANETLDSYGASIDSLTKDVDYLKNIFDPSGQLNIDRLANIIGHMTFDSHNNVIASYLPLADESASHTIEEGDKLVVSHSDTNIPAGIIEFNGDTDYYLSGNGTWAAFPEYSQGLVSLTWAELVAKVDGHTLTPGQWYRITDYCTYVFNGFDKIITSAQLPFDIITIANSDRTLSEHAYATYRDGSNAFDPALDNLSAWKIKYCLKNNYNRFLPVNCYKTYLRIFNSTTSSYENYVRWEDGDNPENGSPYAWGKIPREDAWWDPSWVFDINLAAANEDTARLNTIFGWGVSGPTDFIYTSSETPAIGSTVVLGEATPLVNAVREVLPVSKGYIYYLEDEFGNEACYDFKNILFTWDSDVLRAHAHEVYEGTGSETLCNKYYTFSGSIKKDGIAYLVDASRPLDINTSSTHRFIGSCRKNKIEYLFDSLHEYITIPFVTIFVDPMNEEGATLDNNKLTTDSTFIYSSRRCYNNTIIDNPQNYFLVNSFFDNTINCTGGLNVFDVMEGYMEGNSITGHFVSNEWKLPDHSSLTSGKYPEWSYNITGFDCRENHFNGPTIVNNIIGASFKNNTFMSYVSGGTLYIGDAYGLRNNVIGTSFMNNQASNIIDSCIGDNNTYNNITTLKNSVFGDNISSSVITNSEALHFAGENTGIILSVNTKKVFVDYGVSYIKAIAGPIYNAKIHYGVSGTDETHPVTIPEASDITKATDFVSSNNVEIIV